MAGRKRARSEQEREAGDAERAEPGPGPEPAAPAADGAKQAGADRRGAMADAARRRAAHFAHFQEDSHADGKDANNVHVGSNNARTLGPWSSAVELVNARDKAKSERAERAQQATQAEEEEATIEWQPTGRQTRPLLGFTPVPTLFTSCLGVLNDYVDCIESLYGVPDGIKVKMAEHVCRRRKLCSKAAQLFVSDEPTEVVLPDCHQLDAPATTTLVKACATPRLELLELGACGRGFGDAQAELLRQAGPLPVLSSVKLAGAYRLTDAGLGSLVSAGPSLSSLSLPYCSRLDGSSLHHLTAIAATLLRLDLKACRGISSEALLATLPTLPHLQQLVLDEMYHVDDEVVEMAAKLPCLEELGLSYTQVTDAGLSTLARLRPGLLGLCIDDCAHVTDAGLRELASGCKGLRALSVRRCAKLSDEAVAAVADQGSLQRLVVGGLPAFGNKTLMSLALHCKESLEYLDVSFCRNFSQKALGLVADRCHRLKQLVLFSCSQVGKLFLEGHSNDGLTVVGMGTLCETS